MKSGIDSGIRFLTSFAKKIGKESCDRCGFKRQSTVHRDDKLNGEREEPVSAQRFERGSEDSSTVSFRFVSFIPFPSKHASESNWQYLEV